MSFPCLKVSSEQSPNLFHNQKAFNDLTSVCFYSHSLSLLALLTGSSSLCFPQHQTCFSLTGFLFGIHSAQNPLLLHLSPGFFAYEDLRETFSKVATIFPIRSTINLLPVLHSIYYNLKFSCR
jgi:hypothetical protein